MRTLTCLKNKAIRIFGLARGLPWRAGNPMATNPFLGEDKCLWVNKSQEAEIIEGSERHTSEMMQRDARELLLFCPAHDCRLERAHIICIIGQK